MLRQIHVSNFRSLVQARIDFQQPYTCVIGKNNSGKSNVIAALKWLTEPSSLSDKGLPNVDVSRTATNSAVSIGVSLDIDQSMKDVNFGFPTNLDGVVHLRRDFIFQVREIRDVNNQRSKQWSDYAETTPLHVFTGIQQLPWRLLDEASIFLPQLIHVRPTQIGRPSADGLDTDLGMLRWPSDLGEDDVKWVNDSLNEIFPSGIGHMPSQLSIHSESGMMAIWDEYGYVVPLRKAGNGVAQVIYTLAKIALGRKRNGACGIFKKSLLLCIDEPEQYLSSGVQKNYAKFLKSLSNSVQVIVTSHSSHFLDRNNAKGNCVLMRDNRNGTAQVTEAHSTHELIRNVLGIGIDDSLYLGNVTVLVEGDCDLLAVRRVLQAKFHQGYSGINPDDVTLISRGGASKIPPFVSLVSQLGLPLLIILDNDREGNSAEEAIRNIPNISSVPVLKIPLPLDRDEAEIEDLMQEEVLIAVVVDYLQMHRDVTLTMDDFMTAYSCHPWIKKKKWTGRLREVLKLKQLLPQGKSIDDFMSKAAVFEEVFTRLGILSSENVHSFLWNEVPNKLSEILASYGEKRPAMESGIIPPTRGFSWIHPSNIESHLDHDK